jgi:hypothetical protein
LRQSVIDELQQPGSQPPLQPDDCFRAIAQPVILRWEQPPVHVKMGEPGVRIVVRVLLAAMHRAQPDDAVPLIDPGRTAEGPDTEAIDHRPGDGENALLSLRRRRSDATQLIKPGILHVAYTDVQARYLKAQILRQATDRGASAPVRHHGVGIIPATVDVC